MQYFFLENGLSILDTVPFFFFLQAIFIFNKLISKEYSRYT